MDKAEAAAAAPSSAQPRPMLADLNMSEVEFTGITSVSTDALLAFYSRSFPAKAEWMARHNRWWYRIGVLDNVEPIVVVARGAVIGHLGIRPGFFRFDGQPATAIWLENLAVLPEVRALRLGLRLSRAFASYGHHQIGIGNDSSFVIFVRRGNWKPVDIFRCALPLAAAKIPRVQATVGRFAPDSLLNAGSYVYAALNASRNRAFAVDPLPADADCLLPVFAEPRRGRLEVIRDADWIRWRLLECPFREEYRVIRHDDAVAIVRLIRSSVTRVNLVWCTPARAEASLRVLLGKVVRWALDMKADVIWTVTNNADFRRAARYALPLQHSFSMGACSDDRDFRDEFLKPVWSLFPIDTDLDLMTVGETPAAGSETTRG